MFRWQHVTWAAEPPLMLIYMRGEQSRGWFVSLFVPDAIDSGTLCTVDNTAFMYTKRYY